MNHSSQCKADFSTKFTAWIWDCPKFFRTSGHLAPALGYADIGFDCGVMVGLFINSFHQVQFTRTDLKLHDASSYKFQRQFLLGPQTAFAAGHRSLTAASSELKGPVAMLEATVTKPCAGNALGNVCISVSDFSTSRWKASVRSNSSGDMYLYSL